MYERLYLWILTERHRCSSTWSGARVVQPCWSAILVQYRTWSVIEFMPGAYMGYIGEWAHMNRANNSRTNPEFSCREEYVSFVRNIYTEIQKKTQALSRTNWHLAARVSRHPT